MTNVMSPCAGRVIALAQVNDPVFSSQMMGPGAGIEPASGPAAVLSPVDGKIIKVHPHAVALQTDDGLGVLVHLGINTVKLNGKGFEVLVADGDQVTQGAELIHWNPDEMVGDDISATVMVVALEKPADSVEVAALDADVAAGDLLFTV